MPRKKVNGQDEDPLFWVFSPRDEQKIYLCPPNFFLPPPPSHATLAPGLVRGRATETLALSMFVKGKMQQSINTTALKLAGRKCDTAEKFLERSYSRCFAEHITRQLI